MIIPVRLRTRLFAAAIAAAISLTLPGVVAAHTELVTATPEADSTVPSPFDGPIVLTFSEELAGGSKADLLDPDGDPVAAATVDGPAAAMLFELAAALDPGDYRIEWTGIAVDGHVERGTVAFKVAPPPPTEAPTPTPTPTPEAAPSGSAPSLPPTTPSAEPAASASPAASPTPTEPVGASGEGDVLLPIIVALLVIAAGAAFLLRRRGRAAA